MIVRRWKNHHLWMFVRYLLPQFASLTVILLINDHLYYERSGDRFITIDTLNNL